MTTPRPTVPLQPDDLNTLDRMLKKLVFHHDCGTAEFAAVARIKLLLTARSEGPGRLPPPTPTPASTAGAGEELAACPFCGTSATLSHRDDPLTSERVFAVGCPEDAHIAVTLADTPEEAIAAWNRRASPASETIARLKDDLRDQLKCAYVAGAQAVARYAGLPTDDLDEGGDDYAAQALADLAGEG